MSLSVNTKLVQLLPTELKFDASNYDEVQAVTIVQGAFILSGQGMAGRGGGKQLGCWLAAGR